MQTPSSLAAWFGIAFVVGLSGALMPGPLTMVTLLQATRLGAAAGLLTTIGHGVVEALLVVGMTLGLDAVVQRPQVIGSIAALGALVLACMGFDMVRSAWLGRVSLLVAGSDGEGRSSPPAQGAGAAVAAGVVATLSNPYWYLWWATVGASYVALSRSHGPFGPPSFYAGHILSDLVWLSLVARAVATGRHFLSEQTYRLLVGVLGAFLLYLAVQFGGFAWGKLR